MGNNGEVINRAILRSDLPGEYAPGVPIVEIAGYSRVLIENHMGVCAYGRDRICVKVHYGILSVSGSCLELARMNRYQIVITGKIDSVTIDAKR